MGRVRASGRWLGAALTTVGGLALAGCQLAPSSPGSATGPTLRATATAPSTYGPATAGSVEVPSAAQPGDVLLAQVDDNGPPGQQVAVPNGWSLVPGPGNPASPTQTLTSWVFYKVATSSDAGSTASWSWSGGSLFWSIALTDYSGVNSASPFDGTAFAGGSGAEAANPGITTANGGDLVTAWVASASGPSLVSPAGYNLDIAESTQQDAGVWAATQPSGPTGAFEWSLAASQSFTTAVIALRPPATPPTTTSSPTTSTPTTTAPPSPVPKGLNVDPSYRPWRWAGGPNPDSWWDPSTGTEQIAAEIPLIAGAGATQVRLEFPWTWIEPANGTYDWSHADAIVSTAAKYGLTVEPILVFCPTWEGVATCVPSPADYQAFVTAVASRYKGQIHTYDIWDEPNCCNSKYFVGTESDYVADVLNPAYAAVKAVDPSAQVLTHVLGADTGWIDGLKADGAHFDIFSYHDYPSDPSQVNSDGWTIRNQLNADGYSAIPLWLDEFGTQEDSSSDTTQQSWLTTVFAPGANPAVNIKWYNLHDDDIYCSATSICSNNYYGLLGHDLAQKAAYSTFQSLP